jgi:hypothetical protein
MSAVFSTIPSDELASLRDRLSIATSALREIALPEGPKMIHWARARAELALSFIETEQITDWARQTQI